LNILLLNLHVIKYKMLQYSTEWQKKESNHIPYQKFCGTSFCY